MHRSLALQTTRRPISAFSWLILMVTLCGLFYSSFSLAHEPVTRVYLVRHSEKVDSSRDPVLSEAGQARAQELAHTLIDAEIRAIYVTAYQRSRLTAEPLAQRLGLELQQYPAADAEALREIVLQNHSGESVLVVGHSNTLASIAEAWGIPGLPELQEDQYDRLWVIHQQGGSAEFQALRYGVVSP